MRFPCFILILYFLPNTLLLFCFFTSDLQGASIIGSERDAVELVGGVAGVAVVVSRDDDK